jgi:hypothetical protein
MERIITALLTESPTATYEMSPQKETIQNQLQRHDLKWPLLVVLVAACAILYL